MKHLEQVVHVYAGYINELFLLPLLYCYNLFTCTDVIVRPIQKIRAKLSPQTSRTIHW